MLRQLAACGDDDCLEEDAPRAACLLGVVTTIALEEDAPQSFSSVVVTTILVGGCSALLAGPW